MKKKHAVNEAVRHFIRAIRLKKGLTSVEAARRAGIPKGSYPGLEQGNARISLESLYRILCAIGADIGEVWPWDTSQHRGRVTQQGMEEAAAARPRQASLEDILKAVCGVYRLSNRRLASGDRTRRVAEARTVAAYVLRSDCRHLSVSQLARRLKMSPSSFGKGLKRLESRLVPGSALEKRIAQARARLAAPAQPECEAESYEFRDAAAARSFAAFLEGEFRAVLAESGHPAPWLAAEARCSSVRVTSPQGAGFAVEVCYLSFAAAWESAGSAAAAHWGGLCSCGEGL